MFTATLEKPKFFLKLFDAISSIITQATLELSSEGISMAAMDESHISGVYLDLPSGIFSSYTCDQDLPIHINLFDFNRFLKRGAASDHLTLSLDQPMNKLKVQFKTGKSNRTFATKLLTNEEEPVPRLNLSFNASFNLPASEFVKSIKDSQTVGEFMKIKVTESLLTIETAGDAGELLIELEELGENPQISGTQEGTYLLEYLADIMKAASLGKTVQVEFGNGIPISLTFPIDGVDGAVVNYFLAPRADDDDFVDIADSPAESEDTEEPD